MLEKDITNRELFELLTNKFDGQFKSIDQRFEAIDKRFEVMDQRFEAIDRRFEEVIDMIQGLASHMDSEFNKVWRELRRINSTFVTRDYLDRKFSSFRGDVVEMIDRGICKHKMQMHTA